MARGATVPKTSNSYNWIRLSDGTSFQFKFRVCGPRHSGDASICKGLKIEHIANALAKLPRFGGQAPTFYSVAQHSLEAAYRAQPAFQLEALLHDAHEALGLGDIASPVKHTLRTVFHSEALQNFEHLLQNKVREHFGCRNKDAEMAWAHVANIDAELCLTEATILWGIQAKDYEKEFAGWGLWLNGYRPCPNLPCRLFEAFYGTQQGSKTSQSAKSWYGLSNMPVEHVPMDLVAKFFISTYEKLRRGEAL